MTLQRYVGEDGSGAYKPLFVRDLVPKRLDELKLVFLFESPHVEEVTDGVPVVGDAGRLALDYLLDGRANGQSLGRAVEAQHVAGNERIAILNVCRVPLQKDGAAGPDAPGITKDEWKLLDAVRLSDAKTATSMVNPVAKDVGAVLLSKLEPRVNALHLAPDAVIVAAGECAKRFMRSFTPSSKAAILRVPHPARYGWRRNAKNRSLLEARRLYAKYS